MPDDQTQGEAPEATGQEQVTETPPAPPEEGVSPGEGSRQYVNEQDDDQRDLMRELLEHELPVEGDEAEEPEGSEADRDAKAGDAEEPTRREEHEPAGEKEKPEEHEPQTRTFEFERKGKKFSFEVEPELYEALEALKITADKGVSYHTAYQDALEQLANRGEAGAPTETTEAPEPPQRAADAIRQIASLTSDQYVEQFKPLVDVLADQGYFGDDRDFAEAFPRMATTLALIEHLAVPYMATVAELSESTAADQEKAETHAFFQRLNTALDEVQDRGAGFEALAIPKNRERFFGYLQKLHVNADDIFDSDFLAGQFRAFNHQFYNELEKLEKAQSKKRERAAEKASAAKGGTHTERSDAPPEGNLSPQTKLMRELLK